MTQKVVRFCFCWDPLRKAWYSNHKGRVYVFICASGPIWSGLHFCLTFCNLEINFHKCSPSWDKIVFVFIILKVKVTLRGKMSIFAKTHFDRPWLRQSYTNFEIIRHKWMSWGDGMLIVTPVSLPQSSKSHLKVKGFGHKTACMDWSFIIQNTLLR